MGKVRFGSVRTKFIRSYKLSNYNEMLVESVRLNRKLRKTERYMKLHYLLSRHEYLQFVKSPTNFHTNRISLIEHVAKCCNLIESTDKLKIISLK